MMNLLGVTFLLLSQLGDRGRFLVDARDASATEKQHKEIEKQKEEDKDLIIYPNRPELQLQERYRDNLKDLPPEQNPITQDAVKHGLVPVLQISVLSSREASEVAPSSIEFLWDQVAKNAKKVKERFPLVMPKTLGMLKSLEVVEHGCNTSRGSASQYNSNCPSGYTSFVVRHDAKNTTGGSPGGDDESRRSKGEEGGAEEEETKPAAGDTDGSADGPDDTEGSALASRGKKQQKQKN